MRNTISSTVWNRMMQFGVAAIVMAAMVALPQEANLSAAVLPTLKISKPATRVEYRQPVEGFREPNKQRLAKICLALAILGQRR